MLDFLFQIESRSKPKINLNFTEEFRKKSVEATIDLRVSNSQLLQSKNTQKMCIQFQITISLLLISVCFIFCTLPNCVSTIMIQNYTNNENERKFWQAMNYLSIVPLLTTHSINLFFYYLSSNTFRECFQQYYLRSKT